MSCCTRSKFLWPNLNTCQRQSIVSTQHSTVTPGLSENLIYPTLCCESPLPLCVLFTPIYPTPGLSDTFYEEQMWSDKPGPTVYVLTTYCILYMQENLSVTTKGKFNNGLFKQVVLVQRCSTTEVVNETAYSGLYRQVVFIYEWCSRQVLLYQQKLYISSQWNTTIPDSSEPGKNTWLYYRGFSYSEVI